MRGGEFMHLDPSSDEAPPCRRATVQNAVQVPLVLHGPEIQQININLARNIFARQRKMIDHHRTQVMDELRVAPDDLLKQWDGVWIIGLHQDRRQLLQSLRRVLMKRMGIQKTHHRPYLFGLAAWASELTAREYVTVDHCQHLHLQPLTLHLLDNGVADQTTQRTADQSIRAFGLDMPDLCQIIGSDLLDIGRQLLTSPQPTRLQAVNRHRGIKVPQQAGEAQANPGHRMNAKKPATPILSYRSPPPHDPDRVHAPTAEPLDQGGKIRNGRSLKQAAKWQLDLQVLGEKRGHHRCVQRIAA